MPRRTATAAIMTQPDPHGPWIQEALEHLEALEKLFWTRVQEGEFPSPRAAKGAITCVEQVKTLKAIVNGPLAQLSMDVEKEE